MASDNRAAISWGGHPALADAGWRSSAPRSGSAGSLARVCELAAACLLVTAAMIAAGLAGLWADPWRIAVTWLLVTAALCVQPARRGESERTAPWWLAGRWWLAAGLLGLLILPVGFLRGELHELLWVIGVAAWLAAGESRAGRRLWLPVTRSLALWGLFLLASRFLPAFWLLLDAGGRMMGRAGSLVFSRPLEIGATFAGLEILVLMVLLYFEAWRASGRKLTTGLALAAAVLAVQLVYLGVLAETHALQARLPEVAEPVFTHPYEPPDWRWPVALETWLPWKLPLLAILGHVAMWGLAWRWSEDCGFALDGEGMRGAESARAPRLLPVLGLGLALAATSYRGPADLDGRLLMANLRGRMDWQRPQHDRYGQAAAGMFGMLPRLINSLGGTLQLTEEWSEAELDRADAVLLLHPCTSISPEQRERILRYVRRGGSLLLAAEPYQGFGEVISGHDAMLRSTAIGVRRDVAACPTGPWQPPGMMGAPHPGMAAWPVQQRGVFDSFGSSLTLRWSARPLLVGRWGWSNPGSDAALTGVRRYEPGERLGDMVLAAEQRYGRGRIVVLGNSFCLTNEGLVRGYGLAGRLLPYLTAPAHGPQTVLRQILLLALLVGTGMLLVRCPVPEQVGALAVVLALALPASQHLSRHRTRVVPDGSLLTADRFSRLVYVDASHGPAFSDGHWSPEGINGLALTLMRNDLLPLVMPRVTGERLDGAGLVITIAPARGYSRAVQRQLQEFVRRGGVLICMVGAEEAGASAPLLARFGFRVPRSPVPTGGDWKEPEPLGHMRSMYLDIQPEEGEPYQVGLVLYAGWPVEVLREDGEVLAYGDDDRPVAVMRQEGRGRVVVIGDSHFALNKNLESSGGEPLDGAYENAHFWRWLLSRLWEQEEWVPPPVGESWAEGLAFEEGS